MPETLDAILPHPDAFGIPYDEIIAKALEETPRRGIVLGLSGSSLNYDIGDRHLRLQDQSDAHFRLSAAIDEAGILRFGLYTANPREQRHLDFRAKQFVVISALYFALQGMVIRGCSDMWSEGSDNYSAFRNGQNTHGDIVRAAKGTPAGQAYSLIGLTEVVEEEIVIHPPVGETPESVYVMFYPTVL